MNYAAKRTRTIGCTRCTSRLICHGARSLPSSCRDRLIDLRRTTPDLYADATTERNVGKILGRNESGDYAHRESFARIRIILFYFTLFLLRNRERISFFLFLSPLFLNFETILLSFPPQTFHSRIIEDLNRTICVRSVSRYNVARIYLIHVPLEEVVLPDYPHNFLVEMA